MPAHRRDRRRTAVRSAPSAQNPIVASAEGQIGPVLSFMRRSQIRSVPRSAITMPMTISPGPDGSMRSAGRASYGTETKKPVRIPTDGLPGVTGIEPAISGLTGRRDNQLRYTPS